MVNVCKYAKRFRIVERSRSIQTSRRVVVRTDSSASNHHFSDRDTLALTTRDTADERVSNDRVFRVFNVEHAEQHIDDLLLEFVLGDASGSISRHFGVERESQSVMLLVICHAFWWVCNVIRTFVPQST